ncbi:MAG: ATP phosphoribosyltransferase regulatory subunit [Nannocystaceae bacterium]
MTASEASRAGVFAPLPVGARDLLPDACRRREHLVGSLMATFDTWGYEPVQTPTIEYFDVLGRGLAASERDRCVRFIESGTGLLVSMRPDVTPQIARMVAQRGAHRVDEGKTLRLRYAADVVRMPRAHHERTEMHQLGVELVGDGHPTADAELLLMCHEALEAVGLTKSQFDLTHAGVGRAMFAGLSGDLESQLRRRIEAKDEAGVAAIVAGKDLDPALARGLRSMCSLYGSPEIMARAYDVLPVAAHASLDALSQTLESVYVQNPQCHARISIDLGELRGYDYYTGLRLRVWAPGVPGPVVRGGRYDTLMARYGHDCPASGFAIDLDGLDVACGQQREVARSSGGTMIAVSHIPRRAAAQCEAQQRRRGGGRAWVQAANSLVHALELADATGAEHVVYFGDKQDVPTSNHTQHYTRGDNGWQLESNP